MNPFGNIRFLNCCCFMFCRESILTNTLTPLLKSTALFQQFLNAPFDELKFEKGVGENGAVLLKLIPHIYTVYASQMNSAQPMNTARIVCKYFSTSFLGEKDEIIKVCCLDDNLNIISCQTVLKGNSSSIVVNARRIVEFVLKSNSSLIIIAHNHPNGSELPSDADISATRQLFRILEPLDITLLDHIVVGKNGAVSMKDNGYFDLLDWNCLFCCFFATYCHIFILYLLRFIFSLFIAKLLFIRYNVLI